MPTRLYALFDYGLTMQPTKTRKWMLHVQQKYGLKEITTHGLRHTHCSLLFEAGATIKEVQDLFGAWRCADNHEHLRSCDEESEGRDDTEVCGLFGFLINKANYLAFTP